MVNSNPIQFHFEAYAFPLQVLTGKFPRIHEEQTFLRLFLDLIHHVQGIDEGGDSVAIDVIQLV